MEPVSERLVHENLAFARSVASTYYIQSPGRFYTYEEILSEVHLALVSSATTYPAFCARQSPPSDIYAGNPPGTYFRFYFTRRASGQIKDTQRRDDRFSRRERQTLRQNPTALLPRTHVPIQEAHEAHLTDSTFEDYVSFTHISDLALTAYLSLPHYHRLATAYTYTKLPTDPVFPSPKRAAASATKIILASFFPDIIHSLFPHHPFPPQLVSPHRTTPDPDLALHLASISTTPAALIAQFIEELTTEPSLLVQLCHHTARAHARSAQLLSRPIRRTPAPAAVILTKPPVHR